MALALTAGQIAYWKNKLGAGATSGQIGQAQSKQVSANAAKKTWNPAALAGLADAWVAKGNAPTAQMNAAGLGQPPGMPYSGAYDASIAGLDRNDQLDTAEFDTEETGLKQSYGFDNTNDPFSRQAQLNQAYQNQVRGTGTSMAAAGHLYGGSLQNAQNANRQGYEQNYHNLRSDYQAKLDDLAARRLRAKTGSQNQRQLLAGQRLDSAIASPPGI